MVIHSPIIAVYIYFRIPINQHRMKREAESNNRHLNRSKSKSLTRCMYILILFVILGIIVPMSDVTCHFT